MKDKFIMFNKYSITIWIISIILIPALCISLNTKVTAERIKGASSLDIGSPTSPDVDIHSDIIVFHETTYGHGGNIYIYDYKSKNKAVIPTENHIESVIYNFVTNDYVVWSESLIDFGTNVKLYDKADKSTIDLSKDILNIRLHDVWDRTIIWTDENDLYIYDHNTRNAEKVTNSETPKKLPHIYKNLICWRDNDFNIYWKEIGTNREIEINKIGDFPTIWNKYIFYFRYDENLGNTLYRYNIESGEETHFPEINNIGHYDLYGSFIVWRTHQSDAYFYDIENEDKIHLSSTIVDYEYHDFQTIAIWDNKIVWVEKIDGYNKIFFYEIQSEIFGLNTWTFFSIITIILLVVIITFLYRKKRKKAKSKLSKGQNDIEISTEPSGFFSLLECPSCGKAFKPPPGAKELTCPHCGTEGEID